MAVALLSIRPEFANKLLNGTKRFEFRKKKFSKKLTHSVIYSTAPVKKVVGYFTVKSVWTALPSIAWHETWDNGAGIDRDRFFEYYKGLDVAVAIEVQTMYKLSAPVALAALDESLRVPQSFRYIDQSVIDKLEHLAQKD